jgi:hypothetical protein
MKVSWDDDITNIWENKKSSKPPTSYGSKMVSSIMVTEPFIDL